MITPTLGSRSVEMLPVDRFRGAGPVTAARMRRPGIEAGRGLPERTTAFLRQHPGRAPRTTAASPRVSTTGLRHPTVRAARVAADDRQGAGQPRARMLRGPGADAGDQVYHTCAPSPAPHPRRASRGRATASKRRRRFCCGHRIRSADPCACAASGCRATMTRGSRSRHWVRSKSRGEESDASVIETAIVEIVDRAATSGPIGLVRRHGSALRVPPDRLS